MIGLAITTLYDAVAQRFVDDGLTVPMAFGWRSSAQVGVTPLRRIVWIPGDENGNLGAILPPKYPGFNPLLGARPLATLEELVTIEITSYDTTASENERAQYQATRELFDQLIRAVYLAAHGTYRYVSQKWITVRKERRFGAAIRVVLAVQAVIPDAANAIESVSADAVAALNLAELDVTESIVVAPE